MSSDLFSVLQASLRSIQHFCERSPIEGLSPLPYGFDLSGVVLSASLVGAEQNQAGGLSRSPRFRVQRFCPETWPD